MVILNCFFFLAFFVSGTCFNEFLSLLDVAWVNKVLILSLFVIIFVVTDLFTSQCVILDFSLVRAFGPPVPKSWEVLFAFQGSCAYC